MAVAADKSWLKGQFYGSTVLLLCNGRSVVCVAVNSRPRVVEMGSFAERRGGGGLKLCCKGN